MEEVLIALGGIFALFLIVIFIRALAFKPLNDVIINDEEIVFLAREISKKIESELEYPGQIKVNVVRETRAIDYAK